METKNFYFFPSSRGITVKNQWIMTKFELDLRISIMNLHMQFEPYTYMYIQTKVREWNWNFIKWDNSVNKHSESIAKAIQVPNPSHQIQTCNHFMEPVWNQSWIHNSVKKGLAIPNFKLELDLIVFKLYTKFQLNIYNGPKENERKPFLICIFLSPRGIDLNGRFNRVPKRHWIHAAI